VAALEAATKRPTPDYLCPLCLTRYPRGALDERELTWEHVPPESQRGRRLVLTCKPCNDRAGYGPDAHVAGREAAIVAMRAIVGQSEGVIRGKARIGEHTVRVQIRSNSKEKGIEVIGKVNSPASMASFNQAMEDLAAAPETALREIHLSAQKGYHPRRALIGDLKTAYLATFASFGYTYILQPGMEVIRSQIANPDATIIEQWWIGDKLMDRHELQLAVAESPVGCVMVSLHRSTVLLPIGMPAEKLYERAPSDWEDWSNARFRGLRVPWPTTLEARYDHATASDHLGEEV
jgi:hypothetical protein